MAGQRTGNLLDKNGTSETTATNPARTSTANTDIVTNNEQLALDASGTGLFNSHTKVQLVTSVVHDDDEDAAIAALGAETQQGAVDLVGGRGGKDGAGNGAGEEGLSDEAGKGGLVAGTAAGDDGDVGGGGCALEEDGLLGLVEGDGGVGHCQGAEGGGDERQGLVGKVFRWGGSAGSTGEVEGGGEGSLTRHDVVVSVMLRVVMFRGFKVFSAGEMVHEAVGDEGGGEEITEEVQLLEIPTRSRRTSGDMVVMYSAA